MELSGTDPDSQRSRAAATRALEIETEAVAGVLSRLDTQFDLAVDLLSGSRAIVITALGKPSFVAMKFAATLASIGVHAEYVHAAEALHGDAGRLTQDSVLVAISQSGSTREVVLFAELAGRRGASVVAITGDSSSELAASSDVVLDTAVVHEADPLDLVPTASVVSALALCDALAVALMTNLGTTRRDFLLNHPGGSIGVRLSAELDG